MDFVTVFRHVPRPITGDAVSNVTNRCLLAVFAHPDDKTFSVPRR